jgi:dTDP-glucose 4,6-dehydratase
MKILITGGAGFIGSNYVRELISNNSTWSQIVILDSLTYAGTLTNLDFALNNERIKFIKGDIRDENLLSGLMSDVHTVIHFAAESHVDRSILDPNNFVSTNVLGTANLLKFALKFNVRKFLHISTDEVYGSIKQGSWTEKSPLQPNSPYSSSKASSDLLAISYWKTFGLPVLVSRCSNNFGTNQNIEKLIPLAITNLLDDQPVPIYGNGLNIRDWLHVSDHCRAINSLLENGKPGEIYNIGGGTEKTNLEIVQMILAVLNKNKDSIEFVNDRKGHDFRYSVNFNKIQKDCGYNPIKSFENAIIETVNWYQNNEKWWRPQKQQALK